MKGLFEFRHVAFDLTFGMIIEAASSNQLKRLVRGKGGYWVFDHNFGLKADKAFAAMRARGI